MKRSRRAGFTLVEMMVALTIFSILSVSLATVFRTGIRTWRAGESWADESTNARHFLFLFTRDLKNAVNYASDFPFEGQPDEITFITSVDEGRGEEVSARLVNVAYRYDKNSQSIRRTVAGPQEGFDTKQAPGKVVAEGVVEFKLEYSLKDDFEDDRVLWKSRWGIKKEIPRGVRIRLNDFATTIFIPMGVLGDDSDVE